MPRTPRCHQGAEEACYHVFSRGHNRETVFADAEDGRFFLGLLARYRQRTGFRLYHYCLLTNNFHLLLQVKTQVAVAIADTMQVGVPAPSRAA